ncbi:HNH endonuclease [Paenibacillus sp. y28]|uniref:HNH endonuclease n=1 Tax=Paenibacillus sp. y28 TaxID=3129110 RepID=UPI003FA7D496
MLYEQAFGRPYAAPRGSSGTRTGKPSTRIPDELKWSVWERDNFTCRRCGRRSQLAIELFVPLDRGGTLDKTNLATWCRSCKAKKKGRT